MPNPIKDIIDQQYHEAFKSQVDFMADLFKKIFEEKICIMDKNGYEYYKTYISQYIGCRHWYNNMVADGKWNEKFLEYINNTMNHITGNIELKLQPVNDIIKEIKTTIPSNLQKSIDNIYDYYNKTVEYYRVLYDKLPSDDLSITFILILKYQK